MLAQMDQLKGAESVPAAAQQICLSQSSWEGKLANREVIKKEKLKREKTEKMATGRHCGYGLKGGGAE